MIQENANKFIKKLNVVHFIMFLICVVVWTIPFFSDINKNSHNILSDIQSQEVGWFDSSSQPLDDLIHLVKIADENGEGSIFCRLEGVNGTQSLCFRATHVYYSVYVDDKLIYEPEYSSSIFYTNSPGAYWQTVSLNPEYKNKTLEIRFKLAYMRNGSGFDKVCLASASDYRSNIMISKALPLVLTIVYFAIAFILILIDLLVSKVVNLKHELFYLGFLTLHISIYSLCNLQVLSLFVSNFKYAHMLEVMTLSFLPISISSYNRVRFKFKNSFVSDVELGVASFSAMITFILNVFNILDYHETLILTHLVLVGTVICIVGTMVRSLLDVKVENGKLDNYSFAIMLGLSILSTCVAIDIIRYWVNVVSDDILAITRFGFLFFIVCFSIASSKKIVDAFKNSTVTEFISDLAYKDALTKLGNRTAYEEKLKEYQRRYIDFGIVMCDVNNLKLINDFQGHELGDDLIKNCGRLIKEAFDIPGADVYRIGGDEFVVLLVTENIFKDCGDGVKRLEDLYAAFNAEDHPYKIIIAKGFVKHTARGWSTIEQSIKSADDKMYANKKELKAQANIEVGKSVGNVKKAIDEAVKFNFRRRNDL